MAKRVTERDEMTGAVRSRKMRQTREDDVALIPWTRGPQTRWQKIKRAAVG
jgi:hypothetical protein